MRRLAGLLVFVGCGEVPMPTLSPAPAPAFEASPAPPAPEPTVSPVVPPSPDCGEARAAPSELPSRVVTGRSEIGSGALRPGESLQLGKVELRYEASTWHGTTRAGQRGPGLRVEIDRAEVGEHAAWGSLVQLYPGQTQHTEVGPYGIRLESAAGDPPSEVAITVTREGCPRVATIEPGPWPRWFWVSSEAIRMHILADTTMQISVDVRAPQPRFTLSGSGYNQWLEPRPGAARSLRVGPLTVTLERVVPGQGTRFDGRWLAEGDARVHVLVRIDASERADVLTSLPAAVPASTVCGEASLQRSLPPPALAVVAKIAETRRLGPGQDVKFGPLTLEYGSFEIPAHGGGPYREEAKQVPNLQVLGPDRAGRGLTGFTEEPQLVRMLDALVHVKPDGPGGAIQLARLALRCPAEQVLPPLRGPIYLWLGVLGHNYVRIGAFDVKALHLQLYPDPVTPTLSLGSEHASLIQPVTADLVGLGFTLDDHLIEIVDVQTGAARSDGFGPPTHVQLRVTPSI